MWTEGFCEASRLDTGRVALRFATGGVGGRERGGCGEAQLEVCSLLGWECQDVCGRLRKGDEAACCLPSVCSV